MSVRKLVRNRVISRDCSSFANKLWIINELSVSTIPEVRKVLWTLKPHIEPVEFKKVEPKSELKHVLLTYT